MTDAPEVILVVGLAQCAVPLLHRALLALRPQLRRAGVCYLGPPHVDGLGCPSRWTEAELGPVLDQERAMTEASGGQVHSTLIVSELLTGAEPLAEAPSRPSAEAAISRVTGLLDAGDAALTLYVRRQDRLLEAAHDRSLQDGGHGAIDDLLAAHPHFDYAALADRLAAVHPLTVRPYELAGAGPAAVVDDFLRSTGLRSRLDLAPLTTARLDVERTYSATARALAVAMNPYLETEDERRRTRDFLLTAFPRDGEAGPLSRDARARILDAHRDVNERLFKDYLPDLPIDSYADDEATLALERWLDPVVIAARRSSRLRRLARRVRRGMRNRR